MPKKVDSKWEICTRPRVGRSGKMGGGGRVKLKMGGICDYSEYFLKPAHLPPGGNQGILMLPGQKEYGGGRLRGESPADLRYLHRVNNNNNNTTVYTDT